MEALVGTGGSARVGRPARAPAGVAPCSPAAARPEQPDAMRARVQRCRTQPCPSTCLLLGLLVLAGGAETALHHEMSKCSTQAAAHAVAVAQNAGALPGAGAMPFNALRPVDRSKRSQSLTACSRPASHMQRRALRSSSAALSGLQTCSPWRATLPSSARTSSRPPSPAAPRVEGLGFEGFRG